MSVSLYRKYRPQNFASVVGQKPAVSILTNALTKGSAGHAYLFSGSRGCGKTSIARIFAKALNCSDPKGFEPCGKCQNCTAITAGESLDVIEIDGASNNGVENIRNLRENISLAPFSSKHKIYIIDEVHMLSQGAFNALLKTLEEPPEFVVFIMATTEPYKVPVTIRSRCQHIPFHSISTEDIAQRLQYVCSSEGVNADNDALYEIARQADGALRDGLSLLEQVISSGEITLANVEGLLGAGSRSAFERVVRCFRTDPEQGYSALKAMFDGGASPVRVFEEMFSLVRNMWLVSRWRGMSEGLGLSKSERTFLADEVPNWKPDALHYMLDRTLKALTKARQGMRTDILLGSFMLSLARPPANLSEQITAPVTAPQVQQNLPSLPDMPKVQQNLPAPTAKPAPEFDETLKAELINTALDGDFEVYCALFDVRPYRVPEALILDVEHVYCYERMKIDQFAVKLTDMFMGKYGLVQLRHNGQNHTCPMRADLRPDAAKELSLHETLSVSPQHIAQENTYTDAPNPAPELEEELPASQSAPETLRNIRGKSAIDIISYELTQLAGAEILMKKHNQQQDTDTDTDTDFQEGDNDD